MSFVATGYIMHNKMLNSLKAEGKVPAETTIKDIRLKEVIKLRRANKNLSYFLNSSKISFILLLKAKMREITN